MAVQYAIGSREEALAYLAHPILGRRLIECTRLVNAVDGQTIEKILGYPDDLKFRSSMTLFSQVAADQAEFVEALEKYFKGEPDPKTIALLG